MAKLGDWFKESVLWTHVISILLGWFGWQGLVAGAALSALGIGFGIMEKIPSVILAMATFCFFVAVIWLFQIPTIVRATAQIKPRGERPNPEIWRHVPELTLAEAACLLADTTPDKPSVSRPGDANGWYRALKHAVKDGQMARIPNHFDDQKHSFATDNTLTKFAYEPHEDTLITRSSLKDFAKKTNVVRAFLSGE